MKIMNFICLALSSACLVAPILSHAAAKAPVIQSPQNKQTFQNQREIRVKTSSMKHWDEKGYTAQVLMDGKVRCTIKKDSCTIKPVYRGSHTLQLELRNEHGQFVSQGKAISVFVHLPSRLRK